MTLLERIPVVRNLFRQKSLRKNFLFLLWQEISRNVERYYIVDQRQFISEPFEMDAWKEARDFTSVRFPAAVVEYVAAVESFNKAFLEMKEFEETYLSSVEYKTRANAEILHARKEELQKKFDFLRPLIFTAQKAMREMINGAHQKNEPCVSGRNGDKLEKRS